MTPLSHSSVINIVYIASVEENSYFYLPFMLSLHYYLCIPLEVSVLYDSELCVEANYFT